MPKPSRNTGPVFTRGDAAKVLNVSTLTIANREKPKMDDEGNQIEKAKYPEPKRDMNNYRVYSLDDLMNLQLLTYGTIDTRPIVSILYDKGYRDMKQVGKIIEHALRRRMGK